MKRIMVIGSGPIIIGQGAEFDYSGTQACQVLKEEGHEVILLNNNPATIMTDPNMADKVYMEPLTVDFAKKVIEKERPDALIAGMGGQTALNLALKLWQEGILQEFGVEILGTSVESIHMAEDREAFKNTMEKINQPIVESGIASTLEEARQFAEEIGYPVVVRPAFTLGGTGGGIAETQAVLDDIAVKGLSYSIVGQVLIEKSIKGWKEIEYEMMRDASGTAITVCNMENMDPVGIHTGDSIVIAPTQTLNDKEYQMLRKASIDIVNALDIKGGCNVQLALSPSGEEYYVIEVNPRVSRSSSLASKATGYPIAKVATKIALGYDLDQITNDVTGKTKACFEPALDYCVVKIPKWPFDKFDSDRKSLGTMMMATGEVMAIGTTVESALMKAVRSLEMGIYTLQTELVLNMTEDELMHDVVKADDNRLFVLAELLRRGKDMMLLQQMTGIDPFFISKVSRIVEMEKAITNISLTDHTKKDWLELKRLGFSDMGISVLSGHHNASDVRKMRLECDVRPVYRMVDTCGGEFEAQSPYYYATYETQDEVVVSDRKKVLVLGSGPIRIGQGVEFDYATVHGIYALKSLGYETLVINNNPETVSTDFSTSDKLYFEPITEEDVMNIIDKEQPLGVLIQFGGQTAIKLAKNLEENGVKILGTPYEALHCAEERQSFYDAMVSNDVKIPLGYGVMSTEEGIEKARQLGYPILIRPSFVLGGLGMKVVGTEGDLRKHLEEAFASDPEHTILIDQYIQGLEVEVDAITDGKDVLIPGIMEHLERAGVHSGDSISIYPSQTLDPSMKLRILEVTKTIVKAIGIVGILNIQFIVDQDMIYVIEVNPRASRTVPFLSKVTEVPMVDLAIRCILGEPLDSLGFGTGLYKEKSNVYVKNPIFSMNKIPGVDIVLNPEMKSTGEMLSVSENLSGALFKGFYAQEPDFQIKKKAYIHLSGVQSDETANRILPVLAGMDMEFHVDQETKMLLKDVVDQMRTYGGTVDCDGLIECVASMIVKTAEETTSTIVKGEYAFVASIGDPAVKPSKDTFRIRRFAVENKTLCFTHEDTLCALIGLVKENITPAALEIHDMARPV